MKIIKKMLEWIFRAAAVTIVTTPVAGALIDTAYAERGYLAIGGEWLLIILIVGALWKLSGQAVKHLITNTDQQKGSEKP